MKLWIDDIRPAPPGYTWARSVHEAQDYISQWLWENKLPLLELIDIDHDAGDYAFAGGDYIHFLDWLELMNYNFPIHIHSMNPVGVANMRRIIRRNGWKEI